MNKEEKSRGWKKFVAPKKDYKGWIGLIIGACAVWIAYQSFVFQKNQAEENTPAQSTESSPADASKISNPISGQKSYDSESNQSGSQVDNSNTDPKDDSKNTDPIQTIDKVYDGYKSLDLEKDWYKNKKNK